MQYVANYKYEIVCGKDPEEMPNDHPMWSDGIPDTEEIVGVLTTNDIDFFWESYLSIRENPLAMWYWIIIKGVVCISGAIDPDDLEVLCDSGIVDVPDWVSNKMSDNNHQQNANKEMITCELLGT